MRAGKTALTGNPPEIPRAEGLTSE